MRRRVVAFTYNFSSTARHYSAHAAKEYHDGTTNKEAVFALKYLDFAKEVANGMLLFHVLL